MKVAVVGAGPGGLAVAGHAGLQGFEVFLHDIRHEAIAPVKSAGGIVVRGKESGFAPIALATTELAAAIEDADLILIIVPGPHQAEVASELTQHLKRRQLVVLTPGGTGGALEVRAILNRAGVREVMVAETAGFMYSCNIPEPAVINITASKRRLEIAAIPAVQTEATVAIVQRLFPQIQSARSVLHTSLTNINAVLHLAPMITNAGRIERLSGGFDFYGEGITASVARVIQITDDERMRVARALSVDVPSLLGWIQSTYGITGGDLYETMKTLHREVYGPSQAPSNIRDRYLTEDVPCGAVPIADLGRQFGVDVSVTLHCIALASTLVGRDLWATGRTVERLGLRGLSASEIRSVCELDPV